MQDDTVISEKTVSAFDCLGILFRFHGKAFDREAALRLHLSQQTEIVNSSTTNDLTFQSGISYENLWFLQSGNNLQIDVMGTGQKVTVDNWFSGGSNPLAMITDGGGSGAYDITSQVNALVQAMATYTANHPGFDPTSASNANVPNDPTLQSAVASAWHHV